MSAPVGRALTYTSVWESVSRSSKLVAAEAKATRVPSADITGMKLPLFAFVPLGDADTRVRAPVVVSLT